VIPFGALVTLALVRIFLDRKMEGWAFLMTALNLVMTQISFFMILFPRVMISSTDPVNNSLTIYNASSSPYTLQVMTIVALIFVPIVLVYQGYTYWVFRKRLTTDVKKLTY
jgi:cytochrome d ubiquinol oxidase subunit II